MCLSHAQEGIETGSQENGVIPDNQKENKSKRKRKAKQSIIVVCNGRHIYKTSKARRKEEYVHKICWINDKRSVLFLSGEGRGNRKKEASVTTYNVLKSISNKNQNMEEHIFLAFRFNLK